MEPDYPAAHSMDTTFFAVDRDGHVALFNTGEAGCVPENACQNENILRTLTGVLPRCEIIYDPAGYRLPGSKRMAGYWSPGLGYPVLMFLSSLDAVREDLAAGTAVTVRATTDNVVFWRELSEERHEALIANGHCLGGSYLFDPEDDTEDEERIRPNPSAYGLFYYDHLTENWISGPYGRQRIPAQPVHVDQLPPTVRNEFKSFVFDKLRFTEAPHVQPMEHAPCHSWEGAWLDLSGKRRPVPGREAEFADYDDSAVTDDETEPPATNE